MTEKKNSELHVRGLTPFEISSLKEFAEKSGFENVNAFVVALIREELSEQMMLRYGDRTLKYLETNATVMNNMIDSYNTFIGGNEELLDQVKQLVALLKE